MLNVLYIEDQPDIQKILKLTLTASKKFTVELADNGADGLRRAEELKPDVILLDYSLPDMDGPDVLTILKRSDSVKHIPVIFLTAMTQPMDLERCRTLGALDVITKPFSPRDLASRIETILASQAGQGSAP